MMFIKTLCPQQMLVHKSGQNNHVQLITGVRIAEMSQLQNCIVMCTKNGSYCENEKTREKVRGRNVCTRNGLGVRVDVNGEVKLL